MGGNWGDSHETRRGVPARVGPRDLRLFIVAGEHSGDALGARLMAALNRRLKARVRYLGVGGTAMEREGLISQFPIEEIAVMGPASVLKRLPRIARRIYGTVAAAIAAEPDAVVIIDAPEFTHPIAKRIRRRRPEIPIIDYVSPSVWAWRPGRARRMRRYIDHVLALLPFEPEAQARLGGPPCSYVGHPLIERLDWIGALDPEPLRRRLGLEPGRPVLVVLPGSRRSEVERLMGPFGDAVRLLGEHGEAPEVIIPALPHLQRLIEEAVVSWPIKARIIGGEDDKFRAFKLAQAALAASGTVTLELALAGTPMVVAYRVDALAARLRFLLKAPSVVLANLIAEANIVPELLQEDCTGTKLASALLPLLADTPERRAQLKGLALVPHRLALGDKGPSEAAADIVLRYAEAGRKGL